MHSFALYLLEPELTPKKEKEKSGNSRVPWRILAAAINWREWPASKPGIVDEE